MNKHRNQFQGKFNNGFDLSNTGTEDACVMLGLIVLQKLNPLYFDERPISNPEDVALYLSAISQWRDQNPKYKDIFDDIIWLLGDDLQNDLHPPRYAIDFLKSVYKEIGSMVGR